MFSRQPFTSDRVREPARRRFISALASLLIVAAFVPARNVLAAEPGQQLVLPWRLNTIPKGDVLVLMEGEDIWMRVSDLQNSGLTGSTWDALAASATAAGVRTLQGEPAVALRSLAPMVNYLFDEAELTLAVTADPRLLPVSSLAATGNRPPNIEYHKDTSTFFNYAISATELSQFALSGETGTSFRGNLIYNAFSRATDGTFNRGISQLIIDDQKRLRRWTVGDGTASSDALGGSALIGGVTVSRNFTIDPYFVRYPSFHLSGSALLPSRVQVFVNGVLVDQREVQPGRFDIRDLSVPAGMGDTRVVVRDPFGGETSHTSSFYYSTVVLARGLSEYLYSGGLLRDNFGAKNFSYGDPAAVLYHRYGLTDSLTIGGRAEATRNLWSGGVLGSVRTRAGDFDLSLSGSGSQGVTGQAAQVQYRFLARRFTIGASARGLSSHYANLSLPAAEDRPLLDLTAFTSFQVRDAGINLQWTRNTFRDKPGTNRIALQTTWAASRWVNLFLTVASAREGGGPRQGEVFSGVALYLRGTTANVAYNKIGKNQHFVAALQKPLPVGTGFGYRVQTRYEGGTGTGAAAAEYQSSFARFQLSFDPYQLRQRPSLSMAGGMVYQAGSLILTRPVQDSFALVRVPGVKDVRVFASNQLVGRTDARGNLLVPSLLSYYGNLIRIEDQDIPLDFDVRAVQKTVAPPFRGGAFIPFPVSRVRTIGGSVSVVSNGVTIVPAYGEIVISAKDATFSSPLGGQGEFYLENVPAGRYGAVVQHDEGECKFVLTIPDTQDPVVKLGELRCAAETK